MPTRILRSSPKRSRLHSGSRPAPRLQDKLRTKQNGPTRERRAVCLDGVWGMTRGAALLEVSSRPESMERIGVRPTACSISQMRATLQVSSRLYAKFFDNPPHVKDLASVRLGHARCGLPSGGWATCSGCSSIQHAHMHLLSSCGLPATVTVDGV